MRHHLTNEHKARVTAPGWEANILDWHRDGAAFRLFGEDCALVRQGNGFIPYALGKFLSDKPEYPDAALAIIWRAVHNTNPSTTCKP